MSKQSHGMGCGRILFLIFLVLKLTDLINWSWWWVTAPLWIPFALFTICMIIAFLIELINETKTF